MSVTQLSIFSSETTFNDQQEDSNSQELVVTPPLKAKKLVVTSEIEKEFKISAKTSIFRKSACAPLKWLLEKELITGSCLNFGKGKYDCDSKAIIDATGFCVDYDYTYAPNPELLGQHFDTVFCAYVVNVLVPDAREVVYAQVAKCTKTYGGKAYFAVRSDKDRAIKGVPLEDGVRTSIGTFQIGFSEEVFLNQARRHFGFVKQIRSHGAYRIFECYHCE